MLSCVLLFIRHILTYHFAETNPQGFDRRKTRRVLELVNGLVRFRQGYPKNTLGICAKRMRLAPNFVL